ncbi:SIR2 family NAD-dependent protein deacylase [Brevibacterium jeotgali]|uniref:protein acetyllysine N-acetyltransferase n=1 Tax=Brevibacterium jeotgali TaxID=1262550 RepID=A0A2H1L6J0_9MICO|nr:Sir2 family NAD-dependent protein deacetylase [Brevibacterium jeotgali]TWC02582.1 NAD-dependent deacetylase [Brevibacterium jeotgali]SMY12492.1 NAD-dependent deacetylase [Brevibacterium jeotgali]
MRVVFLTGAGVSTAAGIPDFRGPQGVWTRDPEAERTSTLSWYLGDEDVRRKAWQMRAQASMWEKEPTHAHRAIAGFAETVDVGAVITQNVDGLHQAAGSDPASVLEVHGSALSWRCELCAATGPMEEPVARVHAGEPDPRCAECGGIIRATTILFEEALDATVIDEAHNAAARCDVMVAVGTGLGVYPVAGLFPLAARNGARTIIVNAEGTPFDSMADEVVGGDLQESLPVVLERLSRSS